MDTKHQGQNTSSESKLEVPHLLLCVEGVEVVVVGELSSAGDVLEGKETDSVHSVH